MSKPEPKTIYDDAYESGAKVTVTALKKMGYTITGEFIPVGGRYKIFELKEVESNNIAGFCILSPASNLPGVVLPNDLAYYRERKGKL